MIPFHLTIFLKRIGNFSQVIWGKVLIDFDNKLAQDHARKIAHSFTKIQQHYQQISHFHQDSQRGSQHRSTPAGKHVPLTLDTKLSMKTFDENSCIRITEKLISRAFQSITLVFEYRDKWRCNMSDKNRCSRLSYRHTELDCWSQWWGQTHVRSKKQIM